jgi:hypothetical protein
VTAENRRHLIADNGITPKSRDVVANDVVYLLPIAKVFGSLARLRQIARYGGIVEIWAPWTGP